MTVRAKWQRRTARHGLEAVEIAIRRVRLLAAVLLIGAVLSSRTELGQWGVAASIAMVGLPVALLFANWISQLEPEGPGRTNASIVFQLAMDAAVTVGAITLIDPAAGSYVLVVAGLPVLHGALRYRLSGAFVVWLAVSAGLVMRIIYGWEPGSGLTPFVDLVVPLAIALAAAIPAGHLADQLTDEVVRLRGQRERSNERARLLAVLTVVGQELTGRDPGHLARSIVRAAVEIGFEGVAVVEVAPDGPIIRAQSAEAAVLSPDLLSSSWSPGQSNFDREGNGIVGLASDGTLALVVKAPHRRKVDALQIDALHMLSTNGANSLANAVGYLEIEKATRRLEYDANHDQLTGLLNRAGLLTAFDHWNSPVDFAPFAVFVLDLDGFKAVNDTYGHDAGDQVLVSLGRRLASFAGDRGDASRLGGDEFVLLYPLDSGASIQVLANLEAALSGPFTVDGRVLSVGVSIGHAIVTRSGATSEEALRAADGAMYVAKRAAHATRV